MEYIDIYIYIYLSWDDIPELMIPIVISYIKKSLKIEGVIRIRKRKKNRQHNSQKKKYKRTNNDLQSMHIELKIE